MKSIVTTLAVILLLSCNNKTESSNTAETPSEKTTTVQKSSKEVTPAKPCALFGKDQLVEVFNIQAPNTVEMYDKEKFRSNTNQCQFIWQEAEGSVKGSQIMIDISHKTKDMGATFSRMLELDLQKGLTARENNQTITIMPTPLEGFGDFAYHWTQPNFQNVQIIKFQVRNEYDVKITFNCHEGVTVSHEDIKNKIIEIGKHIQKQL